MLGMAAMSPPLHRGRVLICRGRALADLLPPAQRAGYLKVLRCQHSLSVRSMSSSRRSLSSNYSSSTSSNSCNTGPASGRSRGQRGAPGNVKLARARCRLALGGAALLVAGAALAREWQLPESFSEWDDKVRCLNNLNVKRGAITLDCKILRTHSVRSTRMYDQYVLCSTQLQPVRVDTVCRPVYRYV